MITSFLGKLAASVISFVSMLGFGSQTLGTAVPLSPALVDTYLASGISTTDTSMMLASGVMRNGSALSGFMCFVIDNNQPTTEFVCGTASSTSVTGLSRGVDVFNPNTTSTALAYSHRRFASVQISDYPTLQFLVRKANGTDGYVSSTPLKYDAEPNFTYGNHQIVTWDKSKDYTDSIAVAGAPNADEVTKGISQLATQNQLTIGSSTGSTGASLVPQSKWFNATSSATTTVPVTKSNGKLSQGFLDLTEGFTFSGGVTSTGALVQSATSTLSGATIISGTTTTISSANINIGATSATTTFTGNVVGATKFGGDGSDGALNLTSGTTTISASGASVLIKNYSSISITATGSLAFSNPASTGTLILLRSRGDVTIACTNAPCIDVSGMGAAGGTNSGFVLGASNSYGANGGGCPFDGGAGGGGGSAIVVGGAGGVGGCGGNAGAPGTVFDSPKFYIANNENYLYRKSLIVSPGVGGGTGGSSGGHSRGGGGGGSGGQIVVLYNFTSSTSGTFNLTGGTGGAGGSSGTDGGGGGIGGGVLILEVGGKINFTGTMWAKGNNGTAGGNGLGNAGGAGGAENSAGSAGSASSPSSNGAGGGGGAGGNKIIMKNTEF